MRNKTLMTVMTIAATAFAVGSAFAQLPDPGMEIDPSRTAVVLSDPQNDFLSPEGVTWDLSERV